MNNADESQQVCYHCGLPLPKQQPITLDLQGHIRAFCCHGCSRVCQTIHEAGLQGFYQRTPEHLAPPPPLHDNLQQFDLESLQQEYVQSDGEHRTIHLYVEGIHCAACVWLIERSLSTVNGVEQARVNFSAKRLTLRWRAQATRLSEVLRHLARIGYTAEPFDPLVVDGKIKHHNRALLFRLAFAGFAMMNLLWVSIALYSGANRDEFRQLFHWVGMLLATPVLLYSGYPFFQGAWNGLRRRYLSMDLPISIGALATYTYSLYITVNPSALGEVYYDTVVNFLFVILLGRYLEAVSKTKALDSTHRLLGLQPRAALVLRGGESSWLPIAAIGINDVIVVKPGERIAADGVLIEGNSHVDESMLTGEAAPVRKIPGDTLSAGTVNVDGVMQLRVTATLGQTALGRIIALVQEAQSSKAAIGRMAERFVPWFVLTTLLLAAIGFIWWIPVGLETALMTATAVLIITCPCAFGLATPMAMAVACGSAAREGVLIKNAEVLETLCGVKHFVFDKTGTLTEGRMLVAEVMTGAEFNEDDWFARLAAVEHLSEHRLAKAVVEEAKRRGYGYNLPVSDFQNRPGLGVSAICDGKRLHAGSINWMKQNRVKRNPTLQFQAQNLQQQGLGVVHVAIDGFHCALLAMNDRIREDALVTIHGLRKQGMRLTLLSGDRLRVAHAVAQRLGGMNVIAEVLPENKDTVVQKLQQQGIKIAVVGDGINDAAALKRADVGIALGSGTDVSAENADVVLINDELGKIHLLTRLSRRTIGTIRQNIALSFGYNAVMVPLALAGFVTPLLAAVSMPLSSLLVIGNAARIRGYVKSKNVAALTAETFATRNVLEKREVA